MGNGGCDPRTSCSDATNLFGTKLVQCSACPSGFYGSGRSGCYDINECTVVLNGMCDPRTHCTNFDGGFNCSRCEDITDADGTNLGLVGNPSLREGPGCQPPEQPSLPHRSTKPFPLARAQAAALQTRAITSKPGSCKIRVRVMPRQPEVATASTATVAATG